jgi:hypothetical protein
VCRLVPVLGAEQVPEAPDVPLHALSEAALGRLERFWPGLATSA